MYIFLISALVVSFIGLCFYKSKFWENRYLILLIIGCVSLGATVSANFVMRDKDQVRTELSKIKYVNAFYVSDSLLTNYVLESDSLVDEYLYLAPDSTKIKMSVIFMGDSTNRKVVYVKGGKIHIKNFDEIYIAPSESDTLSYVANKNLHYDIKPNKWTLGMMVRITKETCLFIPPTEYSKIPNSLIRKIQI